MRSARRSVCFTFYEECGLEQKWQVLDIRAVEMIDAAKAQVHGREEGGGAEADECPGAVYLCCHFHFKRQESCQYEMCGHRFSGPHSSYLA